MDFMAICRQRASEEGLDLEELVWAIGKALLKSAAEGDSAAAKLILDRTCGLLRREPTLAVQVNQAVSSGPPEPEGRELVDYFRTLAQLADDLELEDLLG